MQINSLLSLKLLYLTEFVGEEGTTFFAYARGTGTLSLSNIALTISPVVFELSNDRRFSVIATANFFFESGRQNATLPPRPL